MEPNVKYTNEFEKISLEETYKLLDTNAEGLSSPEVKNRLEKFGNNEIVEYRQNSFLKFFLVSGAQCPGCLKLRWGSPLF